MMQLNMPWLGDIHGRPAYILLNEEKGRIVEGERESWGRDWEERREGGKKGKL